MSVAVAATPTLVCRASRQRPDEIVSNSLPGVTFLANRLASRLPVHVDVEDLVQVGLIGLLQSANRFDPQRGVKFQTYANRRVEGAMLDYLRSLDWRPRSVRKRNRRLEKAFSAVEQRRGGTATNEEVAAEIGVSPPELQQWMQDSPSTGVPTAGSFRDKRTQGNSLEYLASMADPADSPEAVVEKEQMRKILAEAIDRLPGNERVVLSLYYYEQLTMKEIGQLLGVKQGRISQLHSQAVARLRNRMRKAERSRTHLPSLRSQENARLTQ